MRADLNKQLCEHERYDSHRSFKEHRHSKKFGAQHGGDHEMLFTRESMTKRGQDKSFGENLNPLFGAVRKAVGRPWNKFYSELSKTFDKRSVINQHIIDHLMYYIATGNTVKVRDGELFVSDYGQRYVPLKTSQIQYYVDPRDGIIKKNKHYKSYSAISKNLQIERAKKEAALVRHLDDENVLRFIDGVWYHFKMKKIPVAEISYANPVFSPTATFEMGYDRVGRGIIKKTWDELNQKEREKHGILAPSVDPAKDVFTDMYIFIEKHSGLLYQKLFGQGSRWTAVKRPKQTINKYYHSSKKTASSKTLKQAGITK